MFRTSWTVSPSGKSTGSWGDLLVIGLLGLAIYSMVMLAAQWSGQLQPNLTINLSLWALPRYGLYSMSRALAAYFLSLVFSLTIGYWAAKSRSAAQILLPLLDIGQSIPVLGFLPGLVLGMVALFPNQNLGLELACILMIFTGQVWNLAFGYYASLLAIPASFFELSRISRLTWWQRLRRIELPFCATSLAWNSLMSMAGGWFFLTVCESFTVSGTSFRVPGLGSYMAVAMEKGETPAIIGGLCAMIALIVGMDFLFWRPMLAWTRKFRLDEQAGQLPTDVPFVEILLKESHMVRFLLRWWQTSMLHNRPSRKVWTFALPVFIGQYWKKWASPQLFLFLRLILFAWLAYRLLPFSHWIQGISVEESKQVLSASLATFLRVLAALGLATVWTVPFGIWVGLSPRRTQVLQPVIQVLASFPAPMLYPLVLYVLTHFQIGLAWGSIVLMLLGVQWYVLFNVLAGASTISNELRDACRLMRLSSFTTWKSLYLPSVLPSLITGWVTAAGGAWNASIIAEYVLYKGDVHKVNGLGALINESTSSGDFHLLAISLLAMVLMVIVCNKWIWRKLYGFAERRYKFDR